MKVVKITWAFDVISPFAYLSLKQLDQLPHDVEIDLLPVLFAGLLEHHGQVGNAEIETNGASPVFGVPTSVGPIPRATTRIPPEGGTTNFSRTSTKYLLPEETRVSNRTHLIDPS